ncbi:hypothetical protein BDV38DRAFT_280181 [Aspergillus pseudotamarii]|uniref:Uncharacterized protein n=1 Tax=Aspergillus pseudotamarii TaxID=132259 RepID=A0A5N6T1N9_ASPPS|nr:uncharacterized protein BDV38DRAFT_280181 [Aspergillus pseudotamarii]KAE8140184.1 hypothetical protein BDV38DRAFT_280181 [Aspergillus pseudotamarii]
MVKILCLAALGLAALSQATKLHVNNGYITVDEAVVRSSIDVSPPVNIYARFDGSSNKEMVKPGCKLHANWESSYGDIYFGEDNCLYDSKGQNINGQCCKPEGNLPETSAMMRVGATVAQNASLLVGREKDSIEALDGTPWWVGDAAGENGVAGRLALGGPRLLVSRPNPRFACHEGDREPMNPRGRMWPEVNGKLERDMST